LQDNNGSLDAAIDVILALPPPEDALPSSFPNPPDWNVSAVQQLPPQNSVFSAQETKNWGGVGGHGGAGEGGWANVQGQEVCWQAQNSFLQGPGAGWGNDFNEHVEASELNVKGGDDGWGGGFSQVDGGRVSCFDGNAAQFGV